MNTRFYNAKILVLDAENHFSIAEDELHVTGDTITYIGPGRKADPDAAETPVFDREIDARGNLLIPGFKNAHTHTPMTFLRRIHRRRFHQRNFRFCFHRWRKKRRRR